MQQSPIPPTPAERGVYVTHDGGDWSVKVLDADFQGAGMDAGEISTANPNIWYAAAENRIYRSDDAGRTWQRFALETPDRVGGLPIDLQVDPRDSLRIFQNAYGGGNMVSTDGGETWQDASQGYSGARIDYLTVSPTSSATVFASAFRSDDGGETWSGLINNARAHLIHQGPEGSYFLVADAYGGVHRSTDGGETWESLAAADTGGQPQIPSLALAPSDPQTVYLGYVHYHCTLGRAGGVYRECFDPMPGLFRSRDGGRTWEQINAPYEGASVTEIAVDPHNSQQIYVGTARGLYVSQDEGLTWEHVEAVDQVAMISGQSDVELSTREGTIIFDVTFDPFNPDRILVAADPGAVIQSQDGGETWQQTASGMDPNEPVADLLPDPQHPGVIYAASRWSGVFVSTDGGNAWRQINQGLARKDVMVLALSADGSVLYAGTASGSGGAGVWRLGTPTVAQP